MQSAREVLERHLKQRQPGIEFESEPLDAHAPGYAFFQGTQEGGTNSTGWCAGTQW
ncbi:MAG TPA: hypothetical protein VH877_08180 [Polyangia bacterium]|jgi:hypothetical protein|nr:hypothetical protein [Polyangia bacterium]